MYSDDGGQSWSAPVQVNDDDSQLDGYSESNENPSPDDEVTGRVQFQPAIAVDQATGTLVISWRDGRDDPSGARVATYLTTSIDGGQTFSAQTYANPSQTAVDAITGQTDVLGPEADNQSIGKPTTTPGTITEADTIMGYGTEMGLAVFGGQVYPVWAGNFNQGVYIPAPINAVVGMPLNIWYRPMVIAAGPRIVTSSMGPIPLAEATSGTVSISVTFDRPINPATFTTGDVEVFYHDTTDGDPSVKLNVTGVTAVSSTQFTITFDPTPPAANPADYNYTGTYSYLIAPDAGPGTTPISAPMWSYVGGTLRTGDPMDQNADGTPDENAVTTLYTGLTPGDVYAVPTPQPVVPTTFLGALSILHPPFDENTLPLTVPGPQVLSTSVPNGSGSDNLVVDGSVNSLSVTFDRPMQVSTVTPGQVLQIMGPTGSISGPQYFPSDVQTGQAISGVLDSTVTVPSFGGTFTIADITVSLTAAFSPDSDLSAVLIAPGGQEVPLFSGVGGTGSNFINTVLDDARRARSPRGRRRSPGRTGPRECCRAWTACPWTSRTASVCGSRASGRFSSPLRGGAPAHSTTGRSRSRRRSRWRRSTR